MKLQQGAKAVARKMMDSETGIEIAGWGGVAGALAAEVAVPLHDDLACVMGEAIQRTLGWSNEVPIGPLHPFFCPNPLPSLTALSFLSGPPPSHRFSRWPTEP